MREFKVLTGVFSAEFGRGAGVVSVSTKSGTNTLHGTAFEFWRDQAFDARNFFHRKTAAGPDPKAPFSRHQFGAAVGAHSSFRVYTAGQPHLLLRRLRRLEGNARADVCQQRSDRGGPRRRLSDLRNAAGQLIPIYDPLTTRVDPTTGQIVRTPFTNNIIPADRIHTVGRNIASIYPLPNGPGSFDNYTSIANREVTDHALSGRVDHKVGENDWFFVRFNWGRFLLDAPQGQTACCLPTPAEAAARFDLGPFVAGIQNTRLTTHRAAFNYSKALRSNLINELSGPAMRARCRSRFRRTSATMRPSHSASVESMSRNTRRACPTST